MPCDGTKSVPQSARPQIPGLGGGARAYGEDPAKGGKKTSVSESAGWELRDTPPA